MSDPRHDLTRNAIDALDTLSTALDMDGYPGLATEIERIGEQVANTVPEDFLDNDSKGSP